MFYFESTTEGPDIAVNLLLSGKFFLGAGFRALFVQPEIITRMA